MHRPPPRILALGLAALIGAVTASVPAAASATPPTTGYTISIGPRIPHGDGSDSPASPYIDKDGTFYFQESASLYGATDPRDWAFYSGTDFDSYTQSAISNAVNPNNSLDKNNDTTWRCNNSPTGIESTYEHNDTTFAERNYCDLIGTWVDPDTGDWYGLVHDEFTPEPWEQNAGFAHYDSIDVAVSTNQGKVWTITGHAITSPYSTVRDASTAFPNQTWDYGDGDPRLFVDVASGYFYVNYASRIQDKPGGGGTSLAHVARAPISSKMGTGSWQKWYNGAWSQPGVGGLESNVVPVDASHPTGYTPVANDYSPANTGSAEQQIAAGLLPSKADLLTMNITYDAYLGLYVGEPEVLDQSTMAPQRYYVTDDLSTQKWYLIGDSGSYTTGSWYRWMVDSVNKTSGTIVGKTYRSYCTVNCGANSGGEYHNVTIDSATPAAPPVDQTKTYLIGNGYGRLLAQVSGSSATTSDASATGSNLEAWQFTSNGDGSFHITNAGTGQALSVDPSSTGSRAWGTKPIVAALSGGSGSVGQQWFIVKNTSPAGTYRIVNRYSGLVLGLSADTSRLAETTPDRSWTNSTGNSVGGARTAAEQTLAFTVAGTGSTKPDLALNKPTTASSVQPGTSYTANLATDGDTSTRWSSAPSDPQWLQVDLGATYSVSEVKLSWEAAYATAFQIQTSNDGSTWTTIYSTTTGAGGVQDLTGLSGTGRYVRMYGTARATGYGYSLWSFNVYGTSASPTDLALNKPTTASSVQSGTSYTAKLATDGDGSTRWSSDFSDPQWLQVDLGATYSVSEVRLSWEAAYATAFQIQTSNDGSTWTTIYSTTTGAGGVQDLTGLSGTGRYVRMYGTARATGYGYSLWSFNVIGT